jgi:hypothetical protein
MMNARFEESQRRTQFAEGVRKRQLHNKIGEALSVGFNDWTIKFDLVSHCMTPMSRVPNYTINYVVRHRDTPTTERANEIAMRITAILHEFNRKHRRQFENAGIHMVEMVDMDASKIVGCSQWPMKFQVIGRE